ncbi:MAG: hypothetical protein SF051_04945 [Elusimicrobiota bacterium]|nr:hypothetical protein [Elusimicrobiota bacterium]
MNTFLLLLLSLPAAAADPSGYVVKAEGATVYLDLTAKDGAAEKRPFTIYEEGEELKHPVTGASLGRAEKTIAAGAITSVAEKFSIGAVAAADAAAVKAGQRARLGAALPAPAPAPAPARAGETETRAPRLRGPSVPYAANAMAIGDFDSTGKPQVVLASDNAVNLYAYPPADAKPLAETSLPGTNVKILGLEAANLDGEPGDELFVSYYDDTFKRFETKVYQLEAGKWLVAAELSYLVRAQQDPAGAKVLVTQQITDDKTFPLGTMYPLAYQDGRYAQGSPRLSYPRADWAFSVTGLKVSDQPSFIYLTTTHGLRVQLNKKSYWRSPDGDYGQTPVRVRWHDKLHEFNPPMLAHYGDAGLEALFVVRNFAALGGLASPFGVFNRGELHSKRWNGLALETAWKAELSGAGQGMAVVETEGRKELAVAVRGAADQTSVWIFDL